MLVNQQVRIDIKKARPVFWLLILLMAWVGIHPAQAHAELVRSVPDANSTLSRSPDMVELFFSEAVDPKLSKLNVLDLGGNVVDLRDGHVDPADGRHMTATLRPLSDGVYTVIWNVIAADDGHQTSGSYPFVVGNVEGGIQTGAQQGNAANKLPLADVLVKGMLYLVAASLVGGVIFKLLVWNPSLRLAGISITEPAGFDQFSWRLAWFSLLMLLVADLLTLLLEAGHAYNSVIGWPWQPAFVSVLLDTRFGVIAIARVVLTLLLAGFLLPPANTWNRWISLGLGLLFLLSFSLESHAASEARPMIPVLADWIHLIAVSVWVGGLFSFLGGMRAARRLDKSESTTFTSMLIPHFTTLALTSVGVLAVTGLYSAVLRLGTFNAVFNTQYGQALIVKLMIAAPMILLGAINSLITTPVMRRAAITGGGSILVQRFSKLLGLEVALGILILIWVAVFTSLPPARITSTPAGFYQAIQANDLTIAFNVDPNHLGINTFTARLTSAGQPVSDAQTVSLVFTSLSGMMPSSTATLTNLGDGTYQLKGGYFGMPDKWDIKVTVVRPGKPDASADFNVDNTAPIPEPTPWRTYAASLIILAALSYAFAFRMLEPSPRRWIGLALAPAAVVILLSATLYLQLL